MRRMISGDNFNYTRYGSGKKSPSSMQDAAFSDQKIFRQWLKNVD